MALTKGVPGTRAIFIAIALAFAATARGGATVEGLVQLPPPRMERPLNQRYQTNADAPLTPSNPPAAVVYLEGTFAPNDAPAVSVSPAQMTQKNFAFAPDLVAVHVGGAVQFPNLDDMYHNVFSYSKAKRFDLGRFRKDEKPASVVFDKPGVVTVHCEIHDRMRGIILVLTSPHFVKTDPAGRYRLEHLPAGHYSLKAWINEADVRSHDVDLTDSATLHVDFPGR